VPCRRHAIVPRQEIASEDLDAVPRSVHVRQTGLAARGARQAADSAESAIEQGPDDRRAEESGRAGDENHLVFSDDVSVELHEHEIARCYSVTYASSIGLMPQVANRRPV